MKKRWIFRAAEIAAVVLIIVATFMLPSIVDYTAGDILTIDGQDYMVQEELGPGVVKVAGPGPGANERYVTRNVYSAHLSPDRTIRRTDPGWQQHASWFYLQ